MEYADEFTGALFIIRVFVSAQDGLEAFQTNAIACLASEERWWDTEFLDIPIEDMRVLGESMMRRGRGGRDADLSFGVLPPLR